MSEPDPDLESQTLAFLKIWTESFAKLGKAAFTFSPDAVPPEMLRQIRSGMFQALAQSWDEFLRSPQFMDGMKQMMEHAVAFRKLSTEFLTKAHQELGGVTPEDVEGMVGAVRHMEGRLLERFDSLSSQIAELNRRLSELEAFRAATGSEPPAPGARARPGSAKPSRGRAKSDRAGGS